MKLHEWLATAKHEDRATDGTDIIRMGLAGQVRLEPDGVGRPKLEWLQLKDAVGCVDWTPIIEPLPKGEDHHRAKLTEAQVRTIRSSNESADDLAKQYGVGRRMINKIRARQSWKWLEEKAA